MEKMKKYLEAGESTRRDSPLLWADPLGNPPLVFFTPFLPVPGLCSPGCSLDGALGLLVSELSPHRLGTGRGPALPRAPRPYFRQVTSTKGA